MVEQLAELTESSVAAATSLDAPRVGVLARERADLMFDIEIRLRSGVALDEPERARTRAAAERLSRAEHRLGRTVTCLLNILAPPTAPPLVYGRAGTLLEVSRGHA